MSPLTKQIENVPKKFQKEEMDSNHSKNVIKLKLCHDTEPNPARKTKTKVTTPPEVINHRV
jgi:hypothetical protein